MKPDKTKKILLTVLMVLAVAVWIRNLNIFKSGGEYYQLKSHSKVERTYSRARYNTLEYTQPHLNPFIVSESQNSHEADVPSSHKAVPQPPAKISSRYVIDGIVPGTAHPQAILKEISGQTVMISANDSLEGWKVDKIGSKMIIFSWKKQHDTLHLLNR